MSTNGVYADLEKLNTGSCFTSDTHSYITKAHQIMITLPELPENFLGDFNFSALEQDFLHAIAKNRLNLSSLVDELETLNADIHTMLSILPTVDNLTMRKYR